MSSAQLDYYSMLEVARDCDGATLKSAYRKLAMKFHPDRNPGDASAEAKFKAINEAYDVLKDPQKRAAYDRFGHAGVNGGGGGGPQFADINDIFGDVFSDFFGGQQVVVIQLAVAAFCRSLAGNRHCGLHHKIVDGADLTPREWHRGGMGRVHVDEGHFLLLNHDCFEISAGAQYPRWGSRSIPGSRRRAKQI